MTEEQDIERRRKEIEKHLDEINHLITGTGPFGYAQVRTVQEYMCEICDVLGIQTEG